MKRLLLLFALLPGASGALAATISAVPSLTEASPGQNFTVDINIDAIPNVTDFQFSLSYNPVLLDAVNVTEGALFANTGDSSFSPGVIDNTAGTITQVFDVLFGSVAGAFGPGTLATVEFTVKLGPGSAQISFFPVNDLILEDSDLDVIPLTAAHAGFVTITQPAVPEASTLALVFIGFGLIFLRNRWLPAVRRGVKSGSV